MRHWTDAYVGIPYMDGETGLHCWGLVRKVLKERAGIVLPAHGDIDAKALAAIEELAINVEFPSWISVPRPATRELDVALMYGWITDSRTGRAARGLAHVGVVVDGGRLLHVDYPYDAVLVSLEHPTVKHRFACFYRHGALA